MSVFIFNKAVNWGGLLVFISMSIYGYVLGYGGGFMERDEVVEYKERIDSDDDEYDEVSILVLF